MGRWQKVQGRPHTVQKISPLTGWKVLELLALCPVPQFSHGIQTHSSTKFSKPQALSCLWRNKDFGVRSLPCPTPPCLIGSLHLVTLLFTMTPPHAATPEAREVDPLSPTRPASTA